MDRFCINCNTALKGRTDKKFCDDVCRSNCNNRLKASNHSFINVVNQILKKNRDILKANNTAKTKRNDLLFKGFDFNFHTYSHTTEQGEIYLFCYEYGYLVLENEEVLLVKREEK